MQVTEKQIDELAKNIADSIRLFFDDPDNKIAYREWHLKRYGCLPKEQEDV